MLKFFIRDGALYTLGSILSKGLSLFLIPIYTRYLSPLEYGIIDLFIILAGIINILITFEITQSIARYYQDAPNDFEKALYTSTAFWFTFFAYIIFIFIAYVFRGFFGEIIVGQVNYEVIFMFAAFSIVSNGIYCFTSNQLKWQLQSKDNVIVGMINLLFGACLILYLMIVAKLKIEAVFIGQIFGNVCAILVAIYYARNSYRFIFNFFMLQEMLKFSIPLLLSSLSGFAAIYIDRIFIKNILGLEELGVYGVGYRFACVASIVFSGFQGALMPLVYKYHKEKNTPNDISRIFDIFCCFSLILLLGSILFSKEMILLLVAEPFYESYKLIPVLVMSILFLNMYIFAPGLTIYKKTNLVALINLLTMILNIILNIILIPTFGIFGAAVSTLIGSLFLFVMYIVMGNRYYYILYNYKKYIFLFLFVLMIGCVLNYLIINIGLFSIFLKILLFLVISILIIYSTFFTQKIFG